MVLFKWLIIITALFIARKDFRERAVEWFLFPLLWIFVLADSFFNGVLLIDSILINTCILLVQLGLLAMWVFVAKRKWLMDEEQFIGWGDIVFFAVLVFCFSPLNFMAFYLGSLMGVLLVSLAFAKARVETGTIPLAGVQALLLALVVLGNTLFGKPDLYSDDFWFHLMSL